MVQAITTKEEFDSVLSSNKIVVVDFHAVWCGPCKAISPKFEAFSTTYTKVKFIKIDVDQVPAVAQTCEIRAMPTFQLFVSGKKVKEVVGADVKKLEEMIKNAA